jgi:hypothetical protein
VKKHAVTTENGGPEAIATEEEGGGANQQADVMVVEEQGQLEVDSKIDFELPGFDTQLHRLMQADVYLQCKRLQLEEEGSVRN